MHCLCLLTAICLSLVNYIKLAFAKYARLRLETVFKLPLLISGGLKQLYNRIETHMHRQRFQGQCSR